MKKLIIISLSGLLTIAVIPLQARGVEKIGNAKAREIKKEKKKSNSISSVSEVSSRVGTLSKDTFLSDFGKVSELSWYKSPNFDEATFFKNGKRMTAYFDDNSDLVGTTTPKTFSDLPKGSQKKIKQDYKNYQIGPVIYFKDDQMNNLGLMRYAYQFTSANNYFVELAKNKHKIILRVNPEGYVYYFMNI